MGCNRPQFSIITVVYNDVGGLALTKSSIISQHFRNFEWLVIDGGSSDGAVNFLEQCDPINLRWVSEKDQGIYDAMNKGVGMCRGDYVVFLNAGDCFSDSGVVADVSAFLSTPKGLPVDVLCCGANLVLADGRKVYRAPKIVDEYIWHGLPANHQATYYRKVILGVQPYDLHFNMCGDYFLAATLYVKNATFGYLDRPVVEFFLDGVSYSWRKELFMEPYAIQQQVLLLGFGWRILSLFKRFVSGAVLRLFNLPMLGNGLFRMFSYIRSRRKAHFVSNKE